MSIFTTEAILFEYLIDYVMTLPHSLLRLFKGLGKEIHVLEGGN